MAELEAGKPVSLQELMVSTLAMTDAFAKLLMRRASSRRRSSAKTARGACGISAHPEPDNSMNGFRLS
jgi:hypothetical protein